MSSFPRTFDLKDTALTPQELLEAMDANPDSLILTASARSARFLSHQYAALQQSRGYNAWPAPRVQAWDTWLSSLWDLAVRLHLEERLLLNEVQEFEVWRTAVASSSAAALSLHSAENLARLAARAWRVMQRYGIAAERLRVGGDVDTRAFREWADAVLVKSRRSGMLLHSQVEPAACTWIADSTLPLPATFLLTGFDQLVPAQQAIVAALQQRNCSVRNIALRASRAGAASPRLYVAPSTDAEITAAAEWARERLVRNPQASIGIFGSFDPAGRAQVERRFRQTLAPATLNIEDRSPLPYEFSLGRPLHATVPVRTALLLLRWAASPLSAEEVSWLLIHGEFTQAAANSSTRGRLDADFRQRPYQSGGSIALPAFLDWLPRHRQQDSFRGPLRALLQAARAGTRQQRRSMPEWRAAIDERLQAAQWQLLAPTTSQQFQLLRRWDALLDQFASLGATAAPQTGSDAMERLQRLAAETLFAEESQDAPVQILGPVEAAGMVFDAVWCMQSTAAEFPPPGHIEPFLPWSVQRDAQMPHTGSVDSVFAAKLAQRIVDSASEVVLSFSLGPDDETISADLPEVLLSPAIRTVLAETPLEPLPASLFPSDIPAGAPLEAVSEEPCVSVQSLSVSGGVRFLELQADCPFRAFAEVRLGSAAVDSPESDLGPRAQGQTLHRVLEAFWRETKTQAQLVAQLTAGELPARLRPLIDEAMAPFVEHAEQPWQRESLALEAQRLHERLLEWLTFEAARPPFSVEQTEVRLEGREIAGVTFTSKVDRVDRVESGIALIDYKTRVTQSNTCWDGDRPKAPQLPAYAALLCRPEEDQPPIAGVALASLEPEKLGFPVALSVRNVFWDEPLSEKPSRTGLAAEEMAATVSAWSSTLEHLAAQFLSGHAVLDPRDGRVACEKCDQRPLCRVAEAMRDAQSEDEDEDTEEA